jgi:hypothetical protein
MSNVSDNPFCCWGRVVCECEFMRMRVLQSLSTTKKKLVFLFSRFGYAPVTKPTGLRNITKDSQVIMAIDNVIQVQRSLAEFASVLTFEILNSFFRSFAAFLLA